MTIEQRVRDRIWTLIQESYGLAKGDANGQVTQSWQLAQCSGSLTSAQNAVQIACPNVESAYRIKVDRIATNDWGYSVHHAVEEMAAVLLNLLRDADAGALSTIADQARAETFDDFLDHAEEYARSKRAQEAGVIAGVVFEDTLRRVCRKHQIPEKDVPLDQLISALTSKGILTATKAKRARVGAHVRTKATHAQWDEYDISDVKDTINFTREFIAAQLDGSSAT